ncbi:class F sortase [Nonomuraea sp. NPDC049714]|uniref:class F sortase n=1 Tax=Nonomuraea sp. NPDC049714 TaxID=3364357 RepID=UPI0037B0F918
MSACGGNGPSGQAQPRLAAEDPPSSISTPTLTKSPRAAEPERIRIPSIGVDARIVKVGLKANGDMETPDFGKAGWYTEGPRPGQDGPAVVVAHVDSKTGPDVFAKLKQLKRGEKIAITDKSGKVHQFVARRQQQTDKTALPVKAIWGKTDGPALRLITCGGDFDRRINHYVSNVIVWADAA